MTRLSARMKLRDLLTPIAPQVESGFDLPDIRDALLLLQHTEGRSFELASALVVEAGLKLTSAFEEIWLDEEPTG